MTTTIIDTIIPIVFNVYLFGNVSF